MTAPVTPAAPSAPVVRMATPDGAHFEMDEVKTAKGTQSLGERPLLVWDKIDAARAFYGEEGITAILDGTSLRVSFQSISRRMAAAGKSDDEIANAQISFRPGKRVVGASTPTSRARSAAGKAAEKVGNADLVTAFLEKIARGEISDADLKSLTS